MSKLKNVSIQGFKSIKEAGIGLGGVNVLIGANGAGKSNFISIFRMLNLMSSGSLQNYINSHGFSNAFLHYGAKTTPYLSVDLKFETDTGDSVYSFRLSDASPEILIFTEEKIKYRKRDKEWQTIYLDPGGKESSIASNPKKAKKTVEFISRVLLKCQNYQFHDTSQTANIKRTWKIDDNYYLRSDGGNLAAYLYMLREKHEPYYRKIISTIRLAAPQFKDFDLNPLRLDPDRIILNWRDKYQDYLFGPHQISDGLLRFMTLATLLLQPSDLQPDIIVIDEPELGLHPYAMSLLGGMIYEVAQDKQIIIATQSVNLLDQFEPEDVIVVEMRKGVSEFKRLSDPQLKEWLEQYQSLGELWEKNVLGGRP